MYLLSRKCQYSATRALMIFLLPVTGANELLDKWNVPCTNWNDRCRAVPPRGWTAAERAEKEAVDVDEQE